MKNKLIIICLAFIISMPFVLGIVSSNNLIEGEEANVDLLVGGVGIEFICSEGHWTKDNAVVNNVGCNIGGVTCCPSDKPFCVNGACVVDNPTLPVNCGEFLTKTSCDGKFSDSEFIYDSVAEQLTQKKISFSADELVASNFCDESTDGFFAYQSGDICRVLKGPCNCEWTPNSPANPTGAGICQGTYPEFEIACSDLNDNPDDTNPISDFQCRKKTNPLEDKCAEEGIYVLSWTAQIYEVVGETAIPTGETTPSCDAGTKTFSCPNNNVQLPFFTIFNLMISLMTILGIYFLMRIEKR